MSSSYYMWIQRPVPSSLVVLLLKFPQFPCPIPFPSCCIPFPIRFQIPVPNPFLKVGSTGCLPNIFQISADFFARCPPDCLWDCSLDCPPDCPQDVCRMPPDCLPIMSARYQPNGICRVHSGQDISLQQQPERIQVVF